MAQNLKKTAQKMKKKGRFGDSELVHVNPIEKKMLEDMAGGVKSKNPDTGLDEHFWSILIPAGIGALTGAMNGGGLKGALKGALLGGATGGLGAGLGGMASGSGFMSGLGSMFGGAGAGGGSSWLGSLFGGGAESGAAGNIAQSLGSKVAASGSAFNPVGIAESLGSKVAASAPVGAVERSFFDRAGDFLGTPQGLTIASGALGMLTDRGDDTYAKEKAERDAKDKNYPIYNNGMRYAEGGAVFDQNNPTPINVGGMQPYAGSMAAFQPYTASNAATSTAAPAAGIGAGDFGKEVYIPKTPSAAEIAGIGAAAATPAKEYWSSPFVYGKKLDISELGRDYMDNAKGPQAWNAEYERNFAQALREDPNYYASLGYTKLAKGGSAKKRTPHTESDMTGPLRPDPRAEAEMAATIQQLEQAFGRRLDNDEVQDLMGRMGGGVGQMMPTPYADGGPVAGIGSGKSDDIPAMLSDGEHVITADEVSMLGDGSNDAGHKKLYDMRKKLRKHKTGRTKQMPKAKAPESYAGIGA